MRARAGAAGGAPKRRRFYICRKRKLTLTPERSRIPCWSVQDEPTIRWAAIPDSGKFVADTLASEARDIPLEKLNQGKWFADTLSLDEIKVDERMADNHKRDPLHIKRRDRLMALIRAGKEINPLIVLGADLFLVDGYARYSVLKELRVKHVRVLRQKTATKQ